MSFSANGAAVIPNLGQRPGNSHNSKIPALKARFILGSARASRAGDGAVAIANFSFLQEHCGEAPQWAREARALPGTRHRNVSALAHDPQVVQELHARIFSDARNKFRQGAPLVPPVRDLASVKVRNNGEPCSSFFDSMFR